MFVCTCTVYLYFSFCVSLSLSELFSLSTLSFSVSKQFVFKQIVLLSVLLDDINGVFWSSRLTLVATLQHRMSHIISVTT